MSRRRLTLAAYVRRRWRVLGAIVVLLLGALLVLAVTDRGHDPIWKAGARELDRAALAPDASAAYALLRDNGTITRLAAYGGEDGELLWQSELNATAAVLSAGRSGVAIATDFPLAFVTVYGADGSIRWLFPLEGNPIAMVYDGEYLALALNAQHNPVLLFHEDLLVRTFEHSAAVRALSVHEGLVAVGTDRGEVLVRTLSGEQVTNVTLDMSPRSLRLSLDGTALVVGGYGSSPADPRGHVAFIDVGAPEPLRWAQDTPVGVGLVDLDAAGLLALAVEESPPSATLHVFDASTGATRWTRLVSGSVTRDDAGGFGGAALSPDARRVAVATSQGNVHVFDGQTGAEAWSYRAGGANVVTFADEEPGRLAVGGRLLANRPFDSIFLFSASGEPIEQSAALLAAAFATLSAIALGAYVGIGYWRARGPY